MKKKLKEKSGTIYKQFEIVSGEVRVTDPCYDETTWCSAEVSNVKNGIWNAWAKKSDEKGSEGRCADLFVWHTDYQKDKVFGIIERIKKGEEEFDRIKGGMGQIRIPAEIGVDSGQAGVFDSKFFKDDKVAKGVERIYTKEAICVDEPWYSLCCDRTLNDEGWGVIPYGAVSSSGWGDGGYTAYKCLNASKEVIGIRIVFL